MNSLGGDQKYLISLFVISLVVAGTGVFVIPDARAWDSEAFRQRMEERRAEREARQEARRAEREAEEEAEQNNDVSGPVEGDCTCSTRVRFSGSSVRWNGNALQFVPRVDVSLRVNGEEGLPDWHLGFNYEGTSNFDRGTIDLPEDTHFSGSKEWGGSCVDTRYRFQGVDLQPVSISGVLRSMFGEDDDARGSILLKGTVSGCDSDQIDDKERIRIKDFGNL